MISARDDVQKMDIFAVGVFVYVLLRGDYPFRAESAQEFTRLIKAVSLPFIPAQSMWVWGLGDAAATCPG